MRSVLRIVDGDDVRILIRYSEDQERDEHGRFGSGGGGGGDSTRSAGPGGGKDLIGRTGGAETAQRAAATRDQYASADGALSSIAHDQGFDGPPQVVDRAEMDRLIAQGRPEMLRGVQPNGEKSAAQIQEEMRSGDAYYGTGVYGNGYYFAPPGGSGFAAAEMFSSGEGALARATLHPDARVVKYAKIRREHEKYFKERGHEPMRRPSLTHRNPTPRDDEDLAFSDLGRFAAARGYDAIAMDDSKAGGYIPRQWLVVNRTALIVERAS